jgi:NAD(P)-dependent dehydrogenase (short-subunit alcohol dehydrogenase family)
VAIHARAPFVAAQAASPHLDKGGRITSIGSNLGERVPHSGVSLYAMTKSALTRLYWSMAARTPDEIRPPSPGRKCNF